MSFMQMHKSERNHYTKTKNKLVQLLSFLQNLYKNLKVNRTLESAAEISHVLRGTFLKPESEQSLLLSYTTAP